MYQSYAIRPVESQTLFNPGGFFDQTAAVDHTAVLGFVDQFYPNRRWSLPQQLFPRIPCQPRLTGLLLRLSPEGSTFLRRRRPHRRFPRPLRLDLREHILHQPIVPPRRQRTPSLDRRSQHPSPSPRLPTRTANKGPNPHGHPHPKGLPHRRKPPSSQQQRAQLHHRPAPLPPFRFLQPLPTAKGVQDITRYRADLEQAMSQVTLQLRFQRPQLAAEHGELVDMFSQGAFTKGSSLP